MYLFYKMFIYFFLYSKLISYYEYIFLNNTSYIPNITIVKYTVYIYSIIYNEIQTNVPYTYLHVRHILYDVLYSQRILYDTCTTYIIQRLIQHSTAE